MCYIHVSVQIQNIKCLLQFMGDIRGYVLFSPYNFGLNESVVA